MKKIILLCIGLVCFLSACQSQKDKKIRVALLTPMSHPSLESIEAGFKETLEAKCPGKYVITTYNAQGNKTLMHSEVEDICRKDYALVVTLGSLASHMMQEMSSKHALDLPIVFTCVSDPVGQGIVCSEACPGGYITGVKETIALKEEVGVLLTLKPHVKKVLLVMHPMQPGLEEDRKTLKALLSKRDIELVTAEVFQTNELLSKISPFMEKVDAVIVLKDNLVVGALDALVKLCCRHHIPLVASDLDSPDRGAAFSYGVYEKEFGVEAAYKAYQILEHHVLPGSLDITPVANFQLKINEEAACQQGIGEETLALYKREAS